MYKVVYDNNAILDTPKNLMVGTTTIDVSQFGKKVFLSSEQCLHYFFSIRYSTETDFSRHNLTSADVQIITTKVGPGTVRVNFS